MRYLLFLLIFASCANESAHKYQPNDTLKTLAFYDRDSTRLLDYVYRVTMDTVAKPELKWVRDTIYFVPYMLPVADSTGKPMNDSTGKPILQLNYVLFPKNKIVKDLNIDVDSLLAK